jgi:predicted DCC family thiol-disulfide oxidoreductase YuxK
MGQRESKVENGDGQVAFFDGVCNLCNGAVNFLLDHDHRHRLRFAPLQGAAFARLAREHPWLQGTDSFVLWDGARPHARSSAILRSLVALGGAWRLAAVGLIVPRPLRDLAYDFLARRRYRWFGRRESCRMPTPELRARFLD